MRRRQRRGNGLMRLRDWAAYNLSFAPTDVADGQVEFYIDWLKLPGGVFDPLTDAPEPVDDTLKQLLVWGHGMAIGADTTTTGFASMQTGIIEWQGISDVPPAITEVPTPGAYPESEWIWWSHLGGYFTIPGNGLTSQVAHNNDWSTRSAAMRKLPEGTGLLLIIEMNNNSGSDVTFWPSWFFRYMMLSSKVKAR